MSADWDFEDYWSEEAEELQARIDAFFESQQPPQSEGLSEPDSESGTSQAEL